MYISASGRILLSAINIRVIFRILSSTDVIFERAAHAPARLTTMFTDLCHALSFRNDTHTGLLIPFGMLAFFAALHIDALHTYL